MSPRALLSLLWLCSVSSLTAQGQPDDDEALAVLEDEVLQQMDVEDPTSTSGAIPGRGGQDYPVYKEVPSTTFTCTGKLVPGYYADPDTRCQVFHICGVGGARHSFLCPEGSVFNQLYLVCDWWYRAACGEALHRLFYTQQISEYDDTEDIHNSGSLPLDEDTDISRRSETRSPIKDKL